METPSFVAYVGVPEIHDAIIAAVREAPGRVEVDLKVEIGAMVTITFTGVRSLKSNDSVGMVVYALSEMKSQTPGRIFVFANSEDEDGVSLEVVADAFTISQ